MKFLNWLYTKWGSLQYYRQNVVYYGKLYGDGKKFIQKYETMELTEKAEKLFKTVEGLWN